MTRPAIAREQVSLCLFALDDVWFGIDTRYVREVLVGRIVEPVPRAPAFIGGVTVYRGEVLTTLDLRAVLGLRTCAPAEPPVVVLDAAEGEDFGLLADRLGSVLMLDSSQRQPNSATVGERARMFFLGAYRTPAGLVVELDAAALTPARLDNLARSGWAAAAPIPTRGTSPVEVSPCVS